jgi:hypothetical protein
LDFPGRTNGNDLSVRRGVRIPDRAIRPLSQYRPASNKNRTDGNFTDSFSRSREIKGV